MADAHDSVNRLSGPGSAEGGRRAAGSHRRRNLVVLVAILCVGGYAGYANRRTPVEPQQGASISWPDSFQPAVKARFRIGTYNIRRGKGTDRVRDLSRTADVLRDADLVGLNEVGGPAFWGQADQAEQLARNLKIGWQFAPNQYRWHMYHFGNALLSRLSVGPWTSEPLVYDKNKSRSHRNLFTAAVVAGPRPITVLVTHLDRGEMRAVQLRHVLQEFQEHTSAVLVGDFNTRVNDPLLVAFFADANNVDAVAQALGDKDRPDRIDWIIVRGLKVLDGGMVPRGVSDHPYYWVDVEVPGVTEEPRPTASPAP